MILNEVDKAPPVLHQEWSCKWLVEKGQGVDKQKNCHITHTHHFLTTRVLKLWGKRQNRNKLTDGQSKDGK